MRDPSDHSSNGMTGTPTALDQHLGTGDGQRTEFALVKTYGSGEATQLRRITRPDFATLLVSLDGAVQAGNWTLDEGGEIGRAHVCNPVTNAHLVCRLLRDTKSNSHHQ